MKKKNARSTVVLKKITIPLKEKKKKKIQIFYLKILITIHFKYTYQLSPVLLISCNIYINKKVVLSNFKTLTRPKPG